MTGTRTFCHAPLSDTARCSLDAYHIGKCFSRETGFVAVKEQSIAAKSPQNIEPINEEDLDKLRRAATTEHHASRGGYLSQNICRKLLSLVEAALPHLLAQADRLSEEKVKR